MTQRIPRAPYYPEMPFELVRGCVVQKLPPDEAENLWPYKWEVVAPVGHRVRGYQTTSLRRLTKKEAVDIARHNIEEGEPG